MNFQSRYSVHLYWCWTDWALGWCGAFAEFGIGTLVLGPLQVQVTWPIDETAMSGAEQPCGAAIR